MYFSKLSPDSSRVSLIVPNLLLAVGTDFPDQALGGDTVQTGDEIVGIDPHVQESTENVEDVVGMYGGEHQMAGQGRLNRDLRGFRVADLPDHDLVGVVAQDGAKPTGEGQPLFFVHRDLDHALDLVFDGVLDGDDLFLFVVDFRESGIKGGRLAAAGRARSPEPCRRVHGSSGGNAPAPFR